MEEKLTLLDSGYFSVELLQAAISGGDSFRTGPVAFVWERLKDQEIVTAVIGAPVGAFSGAFTDHALNTQRLASYLKTDTFANDFAPPSALQDRYHHAIVSIDVTQSNGDLARGTGFVVDLHGQPTLVTCAHVVDPDAVTVDSIQTVAGETIAAKEFRLHPHTDVAAADITGPVQGPLLALSGDVMVFDEVYTFGYPAIPFVADPGLIAHRGEVNGRVNTHADGQELMLISNLIAPGNSGGPLLDRDGHCVGMSTDWLEADYDQARIRYSAAIPATTITAWLDDASDTIST